MKRRLITFLAACSFAAAAHAQQQGYNVPEHFAFDPNGVDMGSLIYERHDTLLSIGGAGPLGLSWAAGTHANAENYVGSIVYWGPPASGAYETRVALSGSVTKFVKCEQSDCTNMSGTGATLVRTGGNWLYTAADGTLYTFSSIGDFSNYNPTASPQVGLGWLQSIHYPDGTHLTINYTSNGFSLASVVSNRGYALKYSTGAVSVINLSRHVCDALISACDGDEGTATIASTQVVSGVGTQQTFSVKQITVPGGDVWTYAMYPVPHWAWPSSDPREFVVRDGIRYFKSPTGYEVQLNYDQYSRLLTFADNRGTFTYSYPDETGQAAKYGSDHTIVVKDPSGNVIFGAHASEWQAGYVEPLPGHQKGIWYAGGGYNDPTTGMPVEYSLFNGVTNPEGDIEKWNYDFGLRGNITSQTHKSKDGTVTLTATATYPATCTNAITCNRPTAMTDANGNATNYAYDPVHGGVLSEMGPAPTSGAARPLKLYTYGQKYAYVKNSSGTLVQAASPVWVPLTVTECQTAAGSSSPVCDTGASQQVTTSLYGANGTADNLLVHGVSVTDGMTTLVTCYGYDSLARKVSETKPMAGLTVCP